MKTRTLDILLVVALSAVCLLVQCSLDPFSIGELVERSIPTEEPFPTIPLPTPLLDKTAQGIRPAHLNDSLFSDDPCRLPCWQGITPGKTRLSEALEILNRLPYVASFEDYIKPKIVARGEDTRIITSVYYEYDDRLRDGYDPLVTFIELAPSGPFTLGIIQDAYGDPQYILVGGGGDSLGYQHYSIAFVYSELGLVMGVDSLDSHKLSVDASLTLGTRLFIYPSQQSLPLPDTTLRMFRQRYSSSHLITWQGYQSYEFYCAQVPKESEEECPRIALTPQPN
jgi:hypothetical protein